MHTLSAQDLGKRFGRAWVFRGLSMSVGSGQSLAVTGRNGSGKSTLLRMLCRLLRPTTGSVRLTQDAHELEAGQHIQAVGYVTPDLSFYRKLSAFENLALVSRLRGLGQEESDFARILERVGLDGRGADMVGGYSSGMHQRLKLAAALLHKPAILVLDEPFSNLDEEGHAVVQSILADQIAAGGIAVLATNSAVEAALCGSSLVIPENQT